jgi:hypothetical protein
MSHDFDLDMTFDLVIGVKNVISFFLPVGQRSCRLVLYFSRSSDYQSASFAADWFCISVVLSFFLLSSFFFLLLSSVNRPLVPDALSDFDETWSVEALTHCASAVFTDLGSKVI